jgi:hypothetical protein
LCLALKGRDSEQNVLGLHGGCTRGAGFDLSCVDDCSDVLGESSDHHRLLSVTPAAMSREACFLWTACLVTPRASATWGQLQPARMARSTSAFSIWSANRRKAATAASPSAGLCGEAISAPDM